MKYFVLFIVLIVAHSSCIMCKDGNIFSDCLNDKFEDFKKDNGAVSIDEYKLKDGSGYWYLLNKNSSAWDGSDPFIDKNCNKVCFTCGECNPPKCLNEIQFVQTIWKK